MNSKPGTYALMLRSQTSTRAQIGRWGHLAIQPGFYIYVGSAFGPGGVLARVSRHCREAKAKHWHIDYLREFTLPVSIWYSHAPTHLEHLWATALAGMKETTPIKGFGCSDCGCEAHLFFTVNAPTPAEFKRAIRGSVNVWFPEPKA